MQFPTSIDQNTLIKDIFRNLTQTVLAKRRQCLWPDCWCEKVQSCWIRNLINKYMKTYSCMFRPLGVSIYNSSWWSNSRRKIWVHSKNVIPGYRWVINRFSTWIESSKTPKAWPELSQLQAASAQHLVTILEMASALKGPGMQIFELERFEPRRSGFLSRCQNNWNDHSCFW